MPSNDVIKQIQKIIYNFIWNKRERIKRNTLIGSINKGGIGVIDIESKIKGLRTAWISRLVKLEGQNIRNVFDAI